MRNLIVATLLTTLSATVAAEGLYVGAKVGYLNPSLLDTDGTAAASLVLGYELADVVLADVALEGEYTRSLTDGEYGDNSGDYSFSSIGLFGAVRSGGFLYLRARGGVVQQKFSSGGTDLDETTPAVGLGLGFSLFGLESSLDWTRYLDGSDVDATDYLSFGMRF